MVRMRARILGLGLIGFLVAGYCVLWLTRASEAVVPGPYVLAEGTALPNIASSAGPVRVLIATQGAEREAEDHPSRVAKVSQERSVYEGMHVGPLVGRDLESLTTTIQRYRVGKEGAAAEFKAEDEDSKELLQQALLLLEMERARAAERALAAGMYVATRQSDVTPLSLPGAEVLCIGAVRNGEPVNITFILPFAQFQELAETATYHKEMFRFDDSEKARAFNGLPYEERAKIVARIDAIRSSGTATRSDRQYVRDTLGFSHELSRDALILYRQDSAHH